MNICDNTKGLHSFQVYVNTAIQMQCKFVFHSANSNELNTHNKILIFFLTFKSLRDWKYIFIKIVLSFLKI